MAYDEETFKNIRRGGMKSSAAQTLAAVAYDYTDPNSVRALLLDAEDEVPEGTATGTLIFRKA